MRVQANNFKPFVLIVAFIFLLCSCNKGVIDDSITQGETLTKDEAINHYKQASYAYGWFEIYNIDYDKNDKIQIEDSDYFKVTHEEIHDFSSLHKFLGQYFTKTFIDSLLNSEKAKIKFVEQDSKLYTKPLVRPLNRYAGDEIVRILPSQNKDVINLLVDVEQLDKDLKVIGTKEYTFLLKYIDGKWLFDDFAIVR